jgi:hypothetical protein
MPTATVTVCIECRTPVRPNKTRCDRCRGVRLDELLDHRLAGMGGAWDDEAIALTSRNTRPHQP